MVSSAVASVDSWIQQAEQVLEELSEQGLSPSIRGNSAASPDGPHDPIEEATARIPVRHDSRPLADATESELMQWAEDFVCAVLGPSAGREPVLIDPEGGLEDGNDDWLANRSLPEVRFHRGQMNRVMCKVICHNLCVPISCIHEMSLEVPEFAA